MVDISSIQQMIMTWFKSGIFWILIAIILFVLVFFIYASMHRKSKLKYNCLELVSFGNGKVGINLSKAGVFKTKTFLGLIDYGFETVTKTKDGRVIEGATTKHLHDIFGKKGFLVLRKKDDPKILVPLSKVNFENLELLMEIAPVDMRNASIRIVKEAEKETEGWIDKYLPYILLGGIIVFFIISMILSIQLINNAVDKSLQIRQMECGNAQITKAGTSP